MKGLRRLLDKAKPAFSEGGRFHVFKSVFDGMETFLFTPRTTSAKGEVHVHDSIDSKRAMIIVVIALLPCFLFGMYNTGYQHWLAMGPDMAGGDTPFWSLMFYGFLTVLPRVVVSYVVGLGIEFIVAQWRREEIQEGFLVTGILIPMILPAETPLWMIAVATAFSVIFVKEVFGGTGYNIFNVALVARAFLFFAYPASMSGDAVFVARDAAFGYGGTVADSFTCATPLGQLAVSSGADHMITGVDGMAITPWQAFLGLMPGSFGETSTLCILIGAAILVVSGIGSLRIMLSAIAGALLMGLIANIFASPLYPASSLPVYDQLLYGGFMFAVVFMATDPVTACRTKWGKVIYGFMIGVVTVIIRTYNTGYPEGAMLAVLLMNALASLIDHCVVSVNIRRRMRRVKI